MKIWRLISHMLTHADLTWLPTTKCKNYLPSIESVMAKILLNRSFSIHFLYFLGNGRIQYLFFGKVRLFSLEILTLCHAVSHKPLRSHEWRTGQRLKRRHIFQLSKWWAFGYRLYDVCLCYFTVTTIFLLAFLLIFQVFGWKRSYCRAEERPQVL